MRIRRQRTASRRADREDAVEADPEPGPVIALTLIAIGGIVAGSVLGSMAFRYTDEPEAQPKATQSAAAQTSSPPSRLDAKPAPAEQLDVKSTQTDTGGPDPALDPLTTAKREDRIEPPDGVTVASIGLEAGAESAAIPPAASARFRTTFEEPPAEFTEPGQEATTPAPKGQLALTGTEESPPALPHIPKPASRPVTDSGVSAVDPVTQSDPISDTSPMRAGRTLRYVSLRAGPDSQTRELTVIPPAMGVLVEDGCDAWCKIAHDGQHGYIYRTYFDYIDDTDVEVAESESDVIDIESRLASQGGTYFSLPAGPAASEAALPDGNEELRWSTTTDFVNLRAGPDNDSDVLAIVPSNQRIMTEVNCTHWCVAIYNGQKGFLYKAYIQPPG